MLQIVYPDQTSRHLNYDSQGFLESEENELGHVTTYEVDTLGRIIAEIDSAGIRTTFDYELNTGLLKNIVQANGSRTEYSYTNGGIGRTSIFGQGNEIPVVEGEEREYAHGRVVRTVHPEGGTIYRDFDLKTGRLTSIDPTLQGYEYNDFGQLTKEIAPNGAETTYVYDDATGRLKERHDPIEDENENLIHVVTKFFYDSVTGDLEEVRTPDPDGAGALTPLWVKYEYDAMGRKVREERKGGMVTRFEYDRRGLLTKIIHPDPDGVGPATSPTERFEYDARGRRVKHYDRRNFLTEWDYDDAGRLKREDRPDQSWTEYSYDSENGRLYHVEHSNGAYQTLTYDETTGQLRSEERSGLVRDYFYDEIGRVKFFQEYPVGSTDPLLRPTTKFRYKQSGELASIEHPDGTKEVTLYDAFGRVRETIGADGVRTTYELNNYWQVEHVNVGGRVTTYNYRSDGRVGSVTLPDPTPNDGTAAPTVSTDFDLLGRAVRQHRPDGLFTEQIYNDNGLLHQSKDYKGNTTTFGHDHAFQVNSVTDARGDTTTFGRDAAGNVTSIIDALANVIQRTVDPYGRTLTESGTGGTRTNTYLNGQLQTTSDPVEGTTTYGYNTTGLLETITNAVGEVVTYGYDAWQRVETIQESDPDGAGPLLGKLTTFGRNARGWVDTITDSLGNATSRIFDSLGRVLRETDQEGIFTAWTYDNWGNTLTRANSQGDTVSYTYDALDQLRTVADPVNGLITYGYNLAGFRTSMLDASGGLTLYGHDANGNLTSLTDPLGNTTTWGHDALNRVISETDPHGYSRTWGYDAAGNLATETDRRGWLTTYEYEHTYDGYRLKHERWWEYAGGATPTVLDNHITYAYDGQNRLQGAADAFSAYDYGYDALGRVTQIDFDNLVNTSLPDVALNYDFDAAGRRSSLTSTIGGVLDSVTGYGYDQRGYLTRLWQTDADDQVGLAVTDKLATFNYDTAGRLTHLTRYEDLTETDAIAWSHRTYDVAGRLESLHHRPGAELSGGTQADPLAFYQWMWDGKDRLNTFETIDDVVTYTYDALDQLTDADYQNDTQADERYRYNQNGNRTESHLHGTDYQQNAGNRLQSDGTHAYTYDNEGNVLTQTELASGEYREYEWDHRNRLIGIIAYDDLNAKLSEIRYVYDLWDRRIGKRVDSDADGSFESEAWYVYDNSGKSDGVTEVPADDIILVFDETGSLTTRYLHGPGIDNVLAAEDASTGEVVWALADHQGTVRDLVATNDVTGETEVVLHRTYDAFGNVLTTTGSHAASGFLYAFTGREWDEHANAYYYRKRWYDPATSRFLSEDPIGFAAGDNNLYRYVGNATTTRTDPSGLEPTPILQSRYLPRWVKKVRDVPWKQVGAGLRSAWLEHRRRNSLTLREAAFLYELQKEANALRQERAAVRQKILRALKRFRNSQIPVSRIRSLFNNDQARIFYRGDDTFFFNGRETAAVVDVGGRFIVLRHVREVVGKRHLARVVEYYKYAGEVPSAYYSAKVAAEYFVFDPKDHARTASNAAWATGGLHLVPGGTALDYLVNDHGTATDAAIATLGDVSMFLTAGASVAAKGGRASRNLLKTAVAVEAGAGVWSAGRAAQAYFSDDKEAMMGHGASALLQLIGVSLTARELKLLAQRRTGFVPSDFGLTSIADDPTQHRLWTQALKNAESWGGRTNDYQRLLHKIDAGEAVSGEELSNAFGTVRGYFRRLAKKEGVDVPAGDIHHWNFNKIDFPNQVFDPRNLFPTRHDIQHNTLHLHLGIGNGIDFNSPIRSDSVLPMNDLFYPLPANFFRN